MLYSDYIQRFVSLDVLFEQMITYCVVSTVKQLDTNPIEWSHHVQVLPYMAFSTYKVTLHKYGTECSADGVQEVSKCQ